MQFMEFDSPDFILIKETVKIFEILMKTKIQIIDSPFE